MTERPPSNTPTQFWIDGPLPFAIFFSLLSVPIFLALTVGFLVDSWKMNPTLHILFQLAVVGFTFILTAIVSYRLFLHFFPLGEGEIRKGSTNELRHQVHCLFWLFLFHNFMLSGIIPVPLRVPVLSALGARIGKRTSCDGYIHDPHMVTIGDNTLLGMDSMVLPHNLSVGYLSYQRIKIGNGVTVGARSIIGPGVQIDDGAIVALNSVVTRNTHIKANEVWAGAPARKIKNREDLIQ